MIIRRMAAVAWAALLTGTLFAQPICPPQLGWQRSFGTDSSESARGILQTADGGFVVAGESYGAAGSGNKSSPNYGLNDMWIVRLDAQGQKLWDHSYGGTRADYFRGMDHAGDGGFILGGVTLSVGGGNKTSPYYGNEDSWIVRIAADGNVLWNKSFGGAGNDSCNAVRRTSDGGFVIGGSSNSGVNGNKTSPNRGGYDYWVVRLDSNGEKLWDASFGGASHDFLTDFRQTADGGFVLGGFSLSEPDDHKTAPRHGSYDYWLVRLDANGNKLWDQSYGGSESDILRRVIVASNGDLLLAGYSESGLSGTKTNQNFAYRNFWVVRVDGVGNEIWQRVYGGTWYDELEDAAAISTNEFLLTGSSQSPAGGGTKTAAALGWSDYWVVRIDGDGNQIWDTSLGGTFTDEAYAGTPTTDGGYLVAGASTSVNGHNTGPHYGASDMWVVKLRPDNALDCDNDGVPNAQDLCADTLFGALVNSNGCSVEQFCPCDAYLDHADYVACVERVSAEFESAGTITSVQRAEMIARARSANCPPTAVFFGLVHVLTKDTFGEEGHFVPGTNPVYGATVLLGEADAGVFIELDAGGWGYSDPAWFLEGKVYGRFAGGSNALIATVRGTKPGIETYPVEIDFSPLNPASLTVEYSLNGVLQSDETNSAPTASFTVNTAVHLRPRVNPFVRLPDGSVGALFEFDPEYDWDDLPYDRIFVRANSPAAVDYVSRVEVAGERSLEYFSFVDERLGMFRNRHRIVGGGIFQAADRHLTVRKHTGSLFGTTIETPGESRVEVDLLPLDLTTYEAGFTIGAGGQCLGSGSNSYPCQIASLELGLAGVGRLAFRPDFSALSGNAVLAIEVFRNGTLAGSCLADQTFANYLELATNQPDPKLIGCTLTAYPNKPPAIAFAVDQLAVLVCTNGDRISGTHFRISPTNSLQFVDGLSSVNLVLGHPGPDAAFTITDERFEAARPRLTIVPSETEIILSWRDNTRLFQLESSASLPNGFTAVDGDVEFMNNQNVIVLPRQATGSRFFRVSAPPE